MDLHIHDDVYMLHFCVDRFGNRCCRDRAKFYIMKGADIVRICYTPEEVKSFIERYKFDDNVPVIGTFSQKLWDARPKNWYYLLTGQYTLHE